MLVHVSSGYFRLGLIRTGWARFWQVRWG